MLSARYPLGLCAALLAGLVGCGGSDTPRPAAKNVILFIGDGMHPQHEVAASRYLTGAEDGLAWHAFPKQGYVSTWDVTAYDRYAQAAGKGRFTPTSFLSAVGYDEVRGGEEPSTLAPVPDEAYFLGQLPKFGSQDPLTAKYPATDSASAGTAMACGFKTDDGNIAWLSGDPSRGGNRRNDGTLRTLAEIAREDLGKSVGVVSTVPFSHATPASFVSHNVSRNNYYTGRGGYTGLGIADEIITVSRPDVVIGGGHPLLDNPTYDTRSGYLSKALHEQLRSGKDFVFAERQAGVDGAARLQAAADQAATEGRRLFGLFGGRGGHFEPPVPDGNAAQPGCTRATKENPLLKDAVVAALTVLKRNPKGFFLMAEQGDIDWANHANDYQWMLGAMWDLNEAVKATLAYIDQPGDDLTRENTLVLVTSDHGNSYMQLTEGKKPGKGQVPRQVPRQAGVKREQLVWRDEDERICLLRTEEQAPVAFVAKAPYASPWIYPDGELSYGSGEHTNELVTLAATGPQQGLDLIRAFENTWYPFGGQNVVDNTHLFHVMHRAFGASTAPLFPAGRR